MKTIINFFKWVGGAFEDQEGGMSSKRVALYVTLYYLYIIVSRKPVYNTVSQTYEYPAVDFNILMLIGVIILFSIGAITSEFITKFASKKKEETQN